MGRSGALFLAACLASASVCGVAAQEDDSRDFWDGFYLGIFGGARTQTASTDLAEPSGTLGVTAGAGQSVNGLFYYGAEATLAAQSLNVDGAPYLWLEADGRLGARLTRQMLLYTAGGVGFDATERQLALTGAAGAELTLDDNVALRAQYSLAHFPEGSGTVHGGAAGVVFKLD